MLYLQLINKKVLTWEENVACLGLFSISFLVFFAALLRMAGMPQAWMSDLSQLLFGWVIFIGSDLALKQNRHIGVEFFEEKLPMIGRKIIGNIWSVFMIGFLGFVTYYGWFLMERSRREFDSLVVSEFNLAIFIPVVILLCVVVDFIRNGFKHRYVYLGIAVLVIVSALFFLFGVDLEKNAEPLSYAFLIASVPVGCVLMIRTECEHVISRWSKPL